MLNNYQKTVILFNGFSPEQVSEVVGFDNDNYLRVVINGKTYRLMRPEIQYTQRLPKLVQPSIDIPKDAYIDDTNIEIIKNVKVSFIISYSESDKIRRRNLECVINNIKEYKLNNVEIILVEQDKKEHVLNIDGVNKIFVNNDGIFNKGYGYNIGAINASNDILFFCDSDIIIPSKYLYNSILEILKPNVDVVDPYFNVLFYDESNTIRLVENKYSNYSTLNFKVVGSFVTSGGAFCIKKNTYMDIKGFDENCYGYGYEDTIFDVKLNKLSKNVVKLNNQICFHLYHPKSNSKYYMNENKNLELFSEYKNMTTQELINKLSVIKNFGIIKK